MWLAEYYYYGNLQAAQKDRKVVFHWVDRWVFCKNQSDTITPKPAMFSLRKKKKKKRYF